MISFNGVQKEAEFLREQIHDGLDRVIDSGAYILGDEVAQFESEWAAYLGVEYVVGVANGTDAITLALMALGVGEGDEVIVPALTAFPSVVGIQRAGAIPVIVDVALADGLLTESVLAEAMGPKVKAILPVHLYGQSVDLDTILAFAKQHELWVVEDCAQAAGATYKGQKVGSLGHMAAFSFYPSKNLGAIGDAGAVACRDSAMSERLKALRFYGMDFASKQFSLPGFNSRLDPLQAMILRLKLQFLDQWNARRREIALAYRDALAHAGFLALHDYGESVFHLTVLRHENRDELSKALLDRGVQSLCHYAYFIPEQDGVLNAKILDCANAKKLTQTVLSLSNHPFMSDEDVETVITALRASL